MKMETRVVWISTCQRIRQIQIDGFIHGKGENYQTILSTAAVCGLFLDADSDPRRRISFPIRKFKYLSGVYLSSLHMLDYF